MFRAPLVDGRTYIISLPGNFHISFWGGLFHWDSPGEGKFSTFDELVRHIATNTAFRKLNPEIQESLMRSLDEIRSLRWLPENIRVAERGDRIEERVKERACWFTNKADAELTFKEFMIKYFPWSFKEWIGDGTWYYRDDLAESIEKAKERFYKDKLWYYNKLRKSVFDGLTLQGFTVKKRNHWRNGQFANPWIDVYSHCGKRLVFNYFTEEIQDYPQKGYGTLVGLLYDFDEMYKEAKKEIAKEEHE